MFLALLLACAPEEAPFYEPYAGGPSGDTADTAAPGPPPPGQCAAPADAVGYDPAPGLADTTDDETAPMEQGAVAMADLDGDGDDDVLIAVRGEGVYLQENDGGALGEGALLADDALVSALALADVDGDRALDVVVAGHADSPRLLRGDGGGGFAEDSGAGMPEVGGTIRGASFGDLDGDGDPDLYLAVAGEGDSLADRLLLNDGSGRFSDASARLPAGEGDEGLTWDVAWLDLERDGDQDLYVVNAEQSQFGPSRLLRNDGGELTDVSAGCFCDSTGNPMGASVADFDGDTLPDLYVTGTGANWLLRNLGDGTFVNEAAALGATALGDPLHMAYGAVVFDHDNDGWQDILLAAGPLGGGPLEQPDALLAGGPEGFADVAPALGLDDTSVGRGVAAGLLDEDGFLDLLVAHLGAPSGLWRARCTDNRALIIDLVGHPPNTFGVGAWVEVHTASRVHVRAVSAHAGWASAVHPRVHVGLGEETPERVVVRWPSGEEQEIELEPDAPLRITVEEP